MGCLLSVVRADRRMYFAKGIAFGGCGKHRWVGQDGEVYKRLFWGRGEERGGRVSVWWRDEGWVWFGLGVWSR